MRVYRKRSKCETNENLKMEFKKKEKQAVKDFLKKIVETIKETNPG